jgi:hypothetical protein
MTTFASSATVKRAVCGHNEADEEEIDDVEDADTPDDLPRGFGDFSLGVFRLGSSQACEFGSAKSKRCCDEDGTESVEAIEEATVWSMPTRRLSQCVQRISEVFSYQYLAPM